MPRNDRPRRRHHRGRGSLAARLAAPIELAAPPLAAAAPAQAMTLDIRWEGGEGWLQGLVDNGTTVTFPEMPKGPAGVRLEWDSPRAGSHSLQFAVTFQGTRTSLVAVATMDGTGGFDEPVTAESKSFAWLEDGDVVPEGGQ